MRLTEVFTRCDALAPLIESAGATDDAQSFISNVQAMPPNAALTRAVRASANDFAEAAGIAVPVMTDAPIAFAGQQPYVDYYPAVPVKLDALAACGGASFFAFADYAPLGSDPWMSRTELPSVAAADGVLRLAFVRSLRAWHGRDLRFVPPPDAAMPEVKPQHMLNAGELARLKEVVSPARLRLLRSLESMTESGSIFGAAVPMVGMTSIVPSWSRASWCTSTNSSLRRASRSSSSGNWTLRAR